MKRKIRFSSLLFGLVCLLAMVGCGNHTNKPAAGAMVTASSSPDSASASTASNETPIRTLTILYTNDEHGWMEGMEPGQGAANLLTLWREKEGYQPDAGFLILSGGDMWTGPAISTWFQGESMAEVMNLIPYAAAAVGNHEFDFGLAALQRRAATSAFPFVSANIRDKASGQTPQDAGIQPYTLVTVNDIRVGIIGLTTTSTPITTNPVNVSQFVFQDYEQTLRQIVPEVRQAGAEVIVVPAHVCQAELESLARRVGDLDIALMGGGHCNELFAREVNGIVLLGGGYHLTSYARATLTFDTAAAAVVRSEFGVARNEGAAPDAAVQAVVDRWRDEADAELNQTIGYTNAGIPRRSPLMESLITETWLLSYPAADVAITNRGGIRADIPPGDLTLAHIIGVLPFDNVLVELQISGSQLMQLLSQSQLTFGGLRAHQGGWVVAQTGQRLDPDAAYHVLVTDFLYAGGDGLDELARFDPDGYNTAVDWRQPIIDWVLSQDSTSDQPLDEALSALAE